MKKRIALVLAFGVVSSLQAQLLKDLSKKAEDKIKSKIEKKKNENTNTPTPATEEPKEVKGKGKSVKGANDFVPGTKVIASEDFAQDALGDFPVNMSSTSGGEVVEIDGKKWLALSGAGGFILKNFNRNLPQNFTIEFTLSHSDNMTWKAKELGIVFATSKNVKKDYGKWGENRHDRDGIKVGLHPIEYSKKEIGATRFFKYEDDKETVKTEKTQNKYTLSNPETRVQIWRQNTRLRVYLDGVKIWDVQEAFDDLTYNTLVFVTGDYENDAQRFYITDLRLAEAGADTRHKLIETGAFSTNEILFEPGKATLKPSSEQVLADLGSALQSAPDFKVLITGHTDSDGNDAENMKLSEKRAESVKQYLNSKFGIDNARMQTAGKGESSPVADNKSEAGKAKNRRVEFIKL